MFECSREQSKPRQLLKPKRVINANLTNGQSPTNNSNNGNASPSVNSKRNNALNGNTKSSYKDEVNVDNLDFTKKILHTSWHPKDNIIAIAATNNLYLFYNKENNYNSSSSSSSTSSSCATSNNSSLNGGFNQQNINVAAVPNSFIIGSNGINESANFSQINHSQSSSPSLLPPLPLNPTTITLTPVNSSPLILPEAQQQPTLTKVLPSQNEQAITNSASSSIQTLTASNSTTNSQLINNQITLNTSFYTTSSSSTPISSSSSSVPVLVATSMATPSSLQPLSSIITAPTATAVAGAGGGNTTSMSL